MPATLRAPTAALAAVFAAVVLARGASAQRTRVSLDLGWRFFLGNPSGGNCTTPYPIPYNDIQCDGLTNTSAGWASAAACAAAACDAGVALWQWCPGGAACGVQSCWTGAVGTCQPQKGWVSMAVNASAPPVNPPASQPGFPDSSWAVVDLPHDNTITGNYSQSADKGEAYLPYTTSFYRKHFALPADWQGRAIELYVEGALSVSSWWLNGVPILTNHYCGYTPIVLRLDNVTGAPLVYGGGANVLVAYLDGHQTTGWWYEGSGLYRRAWLTATYPQAHVDSFGLWAPSFVDGAYHARATPGDGVYADAAIVSAAADLVNAAPPGSPSVNVTVTFAVVAADGVTTVATAHTAATLRAGAGATKVEAPSGALRVANAELWSIPRPYLYTLAVTVALADGGAVVDALNTSVGIRSLAWDPEEGLRVNEQNVKMRGFCNHESFAGVGAALPARVDLLRVQQMRGVGGNAWRTSHNPPEPVLLDIADRLGIAVLDENRVFATSTNCPGCPGVPAYSGSPVDDMAALVRRDRTHASVVWWSFCNEAGCGQGWTEPAYDFKIATYAYDGSRAAGANMGWLSPMTPTNMSAILDVMGFSHAGSGTIQAFHEAEPGKPLVMTECCSCETQRGEDADLKPLWPSSVFYSDENSDCVRGQTQTSNGVPWMAGSFVWTLHDYYGEPDNWPHISSSFGSYDLAGIPKAPVYWYRSWWLANISADSADRPPLANTGVFVRIVESWRAPAGSATGRTLHVYTNAPAVALSVNGVPFGAGPVAVAPYTAAVFNNVPYAAGNVTATALSATGAVLATHSAFSWGAPAAIVLSLDAPNPASGTGGAVYLDGRDVALVRATVVDAAGHTVQDAAVNITFAVTAGPGLVWGVGNGDPASQDPNQVAWRPTYHGVVRGIVRVTVDASGEPTDRALQAAINLDAGAGPRSSSIMQGPSGGAPTSLTVTASAPGLPSATINVPLSVNPADEVLAVAAASVGAAFIGE